MQSSVADSTKGAARRPNAQFTHLGYYLGGEIVFRSRNPAGHHQVVLTSGRPPGMPIIINQLSFIADNLEDLREFHRGVVVEKVKDLAPRNHGNALSIYFADPEGNRIELYTPSRWFVGQPYGRPLDMIRSDPTFTPREVWEARMKARMHGAGTTP